MNRAAPRSSQVVQATVAIVLVGLYPMLSDLGQSVAYPLCAAVAVVSIVAGVRLHRPAVRTPWLLVAGSFSCYLLGDLMYYTYRVAHGGQEPPYPWLSDVAYLAFYPILLVALGQFLRKQGRRDRAAWIDAAIWTLGAMTLLWKPVLEPSLNAGDASLAAQVVATAYPFMDLGLLFLLVCLIAGRARGGPAGALLMASVVLLTVSDLGYAIRTLRGSYVAGEPLDLGWLLMYALVGAAALHPSMASLTKRAAVPVVGGGRGRIVALLIPALLPLCLLIFLVQTAQPTDLDIGAISTVSIAVLILAATRGCDLIGIAEGHASDLHVRKNELESAILDRDEFTGKLEIALQDNERFIWQLKQRADHDTLTGLLSRDRFAEELVSALQVAQRGGPRPSMAFLDVDDFKTVNDTLGHIAGDQLLSQVADRVTVALQTGEIAARFGGDEFAVLTVGDSEQTADRLLTALREPFVVAEHEIRIEISIGVTTAHDLRCSPGDLFREADVAMYAAKSAGGGWARYRAEMSSAVQRRLTMRARLVQALAEDKIEAWFQPVVDLASGRLSGFEALARWCQGDGPPLAPGEWLPWAEDNGLIGTVDRAILRAAVSQLADWRQRFGVVDLELAVNVSGRTLQSHDIDREILDVLSGFGVPAERLVLEVTEGVLIDDQRIEVRLHRLREAGVRIAFDDFGTGWSSLSNLRRLPVDQLKLDRSFTADLGRDRTGDAVPAAIIDLARSLSLEVVAEGVETADQRKRLLRLGFDNAQGYLFGGAQPGRDLDRMVRTRLVAEPFVADARLAVPLAIVR